MRVELDWNNPYGWEYIIYDQNNNAQAHSGRFYKFKFFAKISVKRRIKELLKNKKQNLKKEKQVLFYKNGKLTSKEN